MDVTCSGCGVKLAQQDALYTSEALIVCPACSAKADLVETDKRAAGNIVKAAWGAAGSGVLGFFAPFAFLGIITYFFVAGAVLSAIFAIRGVSAGEERFTQHLSSGQRTLVWVCAMVGLGLAVVTVFGVPARLAFSIMSGGSTSY